ncbi:MAG: putative Peptidase S45 penicillin amidase [Promethearchaeota archaeon]|nr:MAG: putative Peptidase S45 penicillin amidase [Candidatus Lokiarchaeota archaeon]
MEDFLKVAKKSFPSYEGSEAYQEINGNVEVNWDNWGIPHIYAHSIEDAYFTVGLIHSQDRLWQMESMRKLISGRLSEIFGTETIESDKHYRTIGLYRIAKRFADLLELQTDSLLLDRFRAYVKGVNKGILKAKQNPPLEIFALEYTLEEWKLEDSFKIMAHIDWGLSNWNYPLEILREHLITKLGREEANNIVSLYEGTNVRDGIGSNGWAISPKKAKSNSALFANDPHLPLVVPAIWYLLHIKCPGLNVIGATFPGLPIVILGHNENIAWGCTNVHADTIDLFNIELNPKDDEQYKYNHSWVDFKIITEIIKVRGLEENIDYKVYFSEFGPIIRHYELDNHLYEIGADLNYALKWSSYEGNIIDTIEGFFCLNKAKNWNEFRDALKKLTINPQNFIYADVRGNIGHQQAGRIPVRNYGDGATITPGIHEKFDWQRYSEFDEQFSVFNPESEYVYSANFNENKAPNGLLLAQDRDDPYRQKRLKSLLKSTKKLSKKDFINFQADYYSEEASEYLPYLIKMIKSEDLSNHISEVLTLLDNWDYKLTNDTTAGTIYKLWIQEILKAILIPRIGKKLFLRFLGARPFELKKLFKLQKNRKLRDIFLKSLENAVLYLNDKFNENKEKWTWGNLHTLTLIHPLSTVSEEARTLNIGPFKTGGDAYTLNNGYYDPLERFKTIVGPSFRQIHDLSDWNKSLWIIPGGQSGLPFHQHYDDLIDFWLKVEYIPMLYDKKMIKENLKGKMSLKPY